MRDRGFLSVVPGAVKFWAKVIVGCVTLIGLVAGYLNSDYGSKLTISLECGLAGLVFGILIAIWLMCLGYVYADARRRAMRSGLWVLVCLLFPNLLGFLLYFVMRQPIASECGHCGHFVPLEQRFCSYCGTAQPAPGMGQSESSSMAV